MGLKARNALWVAAGVAAVAGGAVWAATGVTAASTSSVSILHEVPQLLQPQYPAISGVLLEGDGEPRSRNVVNRLRTDLATTIEHEHNGYAVGSGLGLLQEAGEHYTVLIKGEPSDDLWQVLRVSPIPVYVSYGWPYNTDELASLQLGARQAAVRAGTSGGSSTSVDYDARLVRVEYVRPNPFPADTARHLRQELLRYAPAFDYEFVWVGDSPEDGRGIPMPAIQYLERRVDADSGDR